MSPLPEKRLPPSITAKEFRGRWTLLNAKNIYQTLEPSDARALIFQKYLIVENIESKVEYLFLLEELFRKDELNNIFSEFLSDKLKEIGLENLPEKYKEIAKKKMEDLNAHDLEEASKIIAGSARSMGIEVKE